MLSWKVEHSTCIVVAAFAGFIWMKKMLEPAHGCATCCISNRSCDACLVCPFLVVEIPLELSSFSGWWCNNPSWKIWVRQWEGWHPIYEMENEKCLKPPISFVGLSTDAAPGTGPKISILPTTRFWNLKSLLAMWRFRPDGWNGFLSLAFEQKFFWNRDYKDVYTCMCIYICICIYVCIYVCILVYLLLICTYYDIYYKYL